MLIDKPALFALLPHAGDMCLLDGVQEWNTDHILCMTTTHRASAHPLARNGCLHAVHLVEYAAQAVAVHGTLLAQGGPTSSAARAGMLAAVRNVRFHVARLDTLSEALFVLASQKMSQADGSIYDFEIRHRDSMIAEGRIVISISQDNTQASL